MIPWEVNLLKLCFIVHHNFHKRLCKAFREKFAPLKKKQFCRFWKRVCTYLFHSSFRCSVLKNRDGGEQQTLYTCWLMPSEFAHFSFSVCVCAYSWWWEQNLARWRSASAPGLGMSHAPRMSPSLNRSSGTLRKNRYVGLVILIFFFFFVLLPAAV